MRILSQQEFLKTPAGADAKRALQFMANSSSYATSGGFDALADGQVTFMQKHLDYLIKHPHVPPAAYISNLRIMTKISR